MRNKTKIVTHCLENILCSGFQFMDNANCLAHAFEIESNEDVGICAIFISLQCSDRCNCGENNQWRRQHNAAIIPRQTKIQYRQPARAQLPSRLHNHSLSSPLARRDREAGHSFCCGARSEFE